TSAARQVRAGQALEQRRLARSRGTEYRDQLSRRDRERDVEQRGKPPPAEQMQRERLVQRLHGKDIVHSALATSSCVYASCGSSRTCSVMPDSTTRPRYMTRVRWASSRITPRS